MARSITLFTGQWADLPLAQLAPLAKKMGYDGLELACWGDHFDVLKAVADKDYIKQKWALLKRHGLNCWAISNHLVGQAICDHIDYRHKAILPADVWGDGKPEGVRQRAAARLTLTAQAARRFFDARPGGYAPTNFAPVVNGFTGSSIWHSLYAFPPTTQEYWEAGFRDFALRFEPVLAAFASFEINFALEVHPTEIAFDTATATRALEAVAQHRRFGFNYDPSHLAYQGVDYIEFIRRFADRIYHVHLKDVWWGHGDGSVGVFGGHVPFGDPRRYWDFRSPGRGDIRFEDIMVALNRADYSGPLSVEWEDSEMDRIHGATEAAQFGRQLSFPRGTGVFDSAFSKKNP